MTLGSNGIAASIEGYMRQVCVIAAPEMRTT